MSQKPPSKTPSLSQQLGQWAEQQARLLLQQAGFEIVAQNYHSRYGEIDLIACKQDEWVFVEVKARQPTQHGAAVEVITAAKQLKMFKTALQFIQQQPEDEALYYRFDVICFDFHQQIAKNLQHDFSQLAYDQQWIENAFTIDADLINL
ncbi:YraN family protein [Acinetobacter sp. 187]|uniref:YraN family protein n=1 Tax=Acinetobacter lanii TaxID=2715163 RepID=UPI00140E27F2|nr:YraN family protein [Acinetobacter lanii]NHC04228.1 YraN family protein [Acinetobacter lanii]